MGSVLAASQADGQPLKHAGTQRKAQARPSILIALFIFSLTLPIIFHVGSVRLSPYRLILIACFVPCIFAWLLGRIGKIRPPDIFLILFCLWGAIALSAHHGIAVTLEPAGILLIETFGSYLLARCIIRTPQAFMSMARWLFRVIVYLLPFAIYETLTTTPILLELFGQFFTVIPNHLMESRVGFDRAQGPFEHPILFGVFCASGIALTYCTLGHEKSQFSKILRAGLVAFSAACSLSSGPLVAVVVQLGLLAWNRFTRTIANRWVVLGAIGFVGYVFIDALSNRSPVEVFISYLTFSSTTGYGRTVIWEYGSAEVLRNPIFGIGLGNNWIRPWWLQASVDNFWLLMAMRYGLPGAMFMTMAFALTFVQLGRIKQFPPELESYRTGLLISIGGLALAGATVHFWNATFCLFMFLLGSGTWMIDWSKSTGSTKPVEPNQSL